MTDKLDFDRIRQRVLDAMPVKGDVKMDELKPCPFCGKPGVFFDEYEEKYDGTRAWCINGQCEIGKDNIMLIAKWNNRPIEDALHVRLGKAEQILRMAQSQSQSDTMLQILEYFSNV